MLRTKKWIAPMSAVVLLLGLSLAKSHADDAPAPVGKATVTVTVVDSDGKPVTGANVNISVAPAGRKRAVAATQPDGGDKPKPVPIATGKTGTDGTVALTKIPDGEFLITARLKGTGNGRATITVADGKDQAVSITLKVGKKKAAAN